MIHLSRGRELPPKQKEEKMIRVTLDTPEGVATSEYEEGIMSFIRKCEAQGWKKLIDQSRGIESGGNTVVFFRNGHTLTARSHWRGMEEYNKEMGIS